MVLDGLTRSNTNKIDTRHCVTFLKVKEMANGLGIAVGYDKESNCIELTCPEWATFPDGLSSWLCLDWGDALEQLTDLVAVYRENQVE